MEQAEFNAASKPCVVLIGDSIRMGYCETVKKDLSDIAQVVFPEENCRFTQYVLTALRNWMGLCDPDAVKIVVFNCGHWDAAHYDGVEYPLNDLSRYAQNIGRIWDRLRAAYPQARVIFATTTPMNPDGSQNLNIRTTEDLICYNEAALRVAQEKRGEVLDLFSIAVPWGSEAYLDSCHYTDAYFEKLGHAVADHLRPLL